MESDVPEIGMYVPGADPANSAELSTRTNAGHPLLRFYELAGCAGFL
jgi:hypothetical protein